MKSNNQQKFPIAYRGYSSQSFISVSSFLEYESYAKDIIFVELRNGIKENNMYRYDKKNSIIMLFNAIELRALSYAMKEMLKRKDNELGYKKFTNSGSVSELYLGYGNSEGKEGYFINAKSSGKTISVKAEKWDFASLADSFSIIADDTERALYKFQRMVKKNAKNL